MTLSFLHGVKAETRIISMTPSSGNVGTTLQLTANISTQDGEYKILFDENEILSGNATGNSVNASFVVPHVAEGLHNVTIIDVTAVENHTSTFTVLTFYSVTPEVPSSPSQLQQGANLKISVNVTGGKSNYTYPLLKIQTPSGNLTYEASSNITTDVSGDYYNNFTYPRDFSIGANANFTGEYKILFNETFANQFFIGLTNCSEYHRGDIANIKAVDYPLNENVNITISFGNKTIDSILYNATDGTINTDWPVPSNVTVGKYNLTITPVPNSKQNASDTQIFDVPGFRTEIFTRNLANQTVPNIFVKAFDKSANAYNNNTSGTDGLANFMLEKGDYSCEAYFKEVRVGEINFTITEEKQVNFTCQLTSVNISVVDAQSVSVPFVFINLTYNYTTNLGVPENRTGTESGETNITGILQFRSLFPNITYAINASRYGEVFNNTIYDLPAEEYVNITILCPTKKFHFQVIDANGQPVVNVIVKAQELMGGLIYDNTTDTGGETVLDCALGRYVVRVYLNAALLNETAFDLFEDQNQTIKCQLCGLNISIKVVDYFGQPIPNANVTLQRDGLQNSSLTSSNGMATFSNIVGGDLRTAVYLPGQLQPCAVKTSYVDGSATIEIRIDKYVMLAGFLVETSQLTTVIIIAVAGVLAVSIEVYRRKRPKPQKSES